MPLVHYMCFDRFLLAFESRDLSHTDKRITRVSSFPSFIFWMIDYSFIQKSYLAIWQNCFGHFITQRFVNLKRKQFCQFFLVKVSLRGLTKLILQKVQASCMRDRKKKTLLITQFVREDTLIILLSAWNKSRDLKAKRNPAKHM